VIAELDHLAFDAFDYPVFLFRTLAMLQDMLDDIVTELVLGQIMNVS
jgi:hypothetical protein